MAEHAVTQKSLDQHTLTASEVSQLHRCAGSHRHIPICEVVDDEMPAG